MSRLSFGAERFSHGCWIYIGHKFCVPNPGGQYKSQPTVEGFFIPSHDVDESLDRYLFGCDRPCRKAKSLQEFGLSGHDVGANTAEQLGQPSRCHHANCHSFSVQERAVARGCFKGMGKRVAVVQNGP